MCVCVCVCVCTHICTLSPRVYIHSCYHHTVSKHRKYMPVCTSGGQGSTLHLPPLTIQPHVLGEGLTDHQVVSIRDQLPEAGSISIQITRGKALVGHVQHNEMVPLLRSQKGNTHSDTLQECTVQDSHFF